MIQHILNNLTEFLGNPTDLQVHFLPTAEEKDQQAALIYLSSITDESKINELFIRPVIDELLSKDHTPPDLVKIFIQQKFPMNGSMIEKKVSVIAQQLFEGKCIFLAKDLTDVISVDTAQWNNRAVTAPETEHSLIGPRDAFVEDLNVNLSMIRRRIRHQDLQVEQFTMGTKSQTKVILVYMKQLVNKQVLEQMQQRIQNIEMDVLVDTTQLGHLILDKSNRFNPFPLFQTTERPDKTVAAMMEGRVLLLADTTPTCAIFPSTVSALYQTTDDYFFPSVSGTFIRLVRYVGMLTTLLLPGLYVAFTSVNSDALRIQFMLAVAASREGLPYPAYIEVLIMITLLELINEATVRLPKVIGGTATIVGGLIIGSSAAQSHLVSNIMIVVTGTVAIGSYTVANYMIGIAWRMCSYGLMLLAIPWGVDGMATGAALILLYLCHIKSMGIPYLSPLSTFQLKELFRDALIRLPAAMNPFRPSVYSKSAEGSRRVRIREGEDSL